MNEYLKAFQDVTHSVEQLLANEYRCLESMEIKQSAATLEKSIEPCVQELKLSAAKLRELIRACFDCLDHSQDVWESKSRITAAPQAAILQQLGEISGCHFRIQRTSENCKKVAIEQAKNSWGEEIDLLFNKYFSSADKKPKGGIGWNDKTGFLKDIESVINLESIKLNQFIKLNLGIVFQEISIDGLKSIYFQVNLLDRREKANYDKRLSKTIEELSARFTDSTISNNLYSANLGAICKPSLDRWRGDWGNILWSQVITFRNEIAAKIEQRITLTFDNRLELAKKALEQTVSFYDDFLARQERYQQETPAQRQAEKAWLEQQYQKLAQIKSDLEAILS